MLRKSQMQGSLPKRDAGVLDKVRRGATEAGNAADGALSASGVAFFDVDNTLVQGYSGFYTTLLLIQKGILKKRRLAQALFYRLIGPLTSGKGSSQDLLKRMYEIAIRDMAGLHLDDILKIGRDCFEKWMRPRVYSEGVEKVREHQERGDKIYLISSGPAMTISFLADFLAVDGHFSCGPVIDADNLLTARVRMPIYYREGKVAAAAEALKRHGARWSDCHFYSDSLDDLFLLERVGHPVLVNPEKKLLRIGQKRGWPVLRFSARVFK